MGDCCHLNDPVPEGTKFVLQPRKSGFDVKFRNRLKDLPSGISISKSKGRPMNVKNLPKYVDAIGEQQAIAVTKIFLEDRHWYTKMVNSEPRPLALKFSPSC